MERYLNLARALMGIQGYVPLTAAQIRYLRSKLKQIPPENEALICETFKRYKTDDSIEAIYAATPALSKAVDKLRAIINPDILSIGLKNYDQIAEMMINLLEPATQGTALLTTLPEPNEGKPLTKEALQAIDDFWRLCPVDNDFVKEQCREIIDTVRESNYVDFMSELLHRFKHVAPPEIHEKVCCYLEEYVEMLLKYRKMQSIKPRAIAYLCSHSLIDARHPTERMKDYENFLGRTDNDGKIKLLSKYVEKLRRAECFTIDDVLMKYVWGFDFKRRVEYIGQGTVSAIEGFFKFFLGDIVLDELRLKFPVTSDI